jgi:16S rRNA processing protein RimM
MLPESLIPIGRLGKPWGNQGELTVDLAACDLDDLPHEGWLFVDIDGQHVPFHYGALYDKGRAGILVRFDRLEDPAHMRLLTGRTVLVPAHALGDAAPLPTPDIDDLIGLAVHDADHGALGTVVAIAGSDRNPVMVVQHGEQEVMVPVADELITGFDPATRTLHVRTPPGLLDLYR